MRSGAGDREEIPPAQQEDGTTEWSRNLHDEDRTKIVEYDRRKDDQRWRMRRERLQLGTMSQHREEPASPRWVQGYR